MRLDDQLQLGMANLWRTKLRTVLTTLGVSIGIGALVSMVSFGTGMQKNITQTFKENDLFTSMQVTSKKIDVEQVMAGNVEGVVESLQEDTPPLDEVALRVIQDLPGVELAFPEIRFPVKVKFGEHETQADEDQDDTSLIPTSTTANFSLQIRHLLSLFIREF